MNKAVWFGLAAVLGGIATGVVVAVQIQPQIPSIPSSAPPPAVVADVRPPDATFASVFEPCAHCHQIGPGARMTTGPSLQGLIGRKAGALAGYPFSPAMQGSGLNWDEATLDRFIASPQSVVPGTRMIYAGMDDPEQRKALIGFITKIGATH